MTKTHFIDLSSDTASKPTSGMYQAMISAEVGDEQKRADPSVNALCERVARLLGKEAAVFLPSGVMCNMIAGAMRSRRRNHYGRTKSCAQYGGWCSSSTGRSGNQTTRWPTRHVQQRRCQAGNTPFTEKKHCQNGADIDRAELQPGWRQHLALGNDHRDQSDCSRTFDRDAYGWRASLECFGGVRHSTGRVRGKVRYGLD